MVFGHSFLVFYYCKIFKVEKYDLHANKWTRVASMTSKRLGLALVVLGNYLYAIGGSDGQSPLNTVEKCTNNF